RSRPCSASWRAWGRSGTPAGAAPVALRRLGKSGSAGGMGRQVVEHHANALRLGIMDIGEVAHADGEVFRGAPFGDLELAPVAVHIQEHEQVRGSVAFIFAVVALDLPRLG